jgi:phenylacetate-CoA ligase
MSPFLVRHLLFPLHERLMARPTLDMVRASRYIETLPAHDIAVVQRNKLRQLMRYAFDRCPFYQRQFLETGCDLAAVDALGELSKLPLLDKTIISENIDEMVDPSLRRTLRKSSTGGSSGQRLTFYLGRRRQAADKAGRIRTHWWYGVRPGDRECYLWGAPAELDANDLIKSCRDRVTNELLLNAFQMNAPTMSRYIDQINMYQPTALFGYPSSLAMLAEFGLSAELSIDTPPLRAVFATGEVLTDRDRRLIGQYFHVPVVNGYGSREAGFIAHECTAGKMHTMADHVFVELLNESGQTVAVGETGEIVVTHLESYGMPFVRYRTGDMAERVSGECACRLGLPMIGKVTGRSTDHVIATDGTARHALSLIYVLREVEQIEQFQIRQSRNRHLEVLIRSARRLDEGTADTIEKKIRRQMGMDAQIMLREVSEIPPAPSGKHRYVISDALPTP